MNKKTMVFAAIAGGMAAFGLTQSAQADNLVVNGDFEVNGGNGQLGFNTTAAGWSIGDPNSSSYTFLYAPGTADTTGAPGQYGVVPLWGPNNGANNGLPATSPSGGYFLASDGDFQQNAVQQTVTGLKVGDTYALSFYYAGAQQSGFTGPSTDGWQVSLGSSTQSTPILNNASEGFTGWQTETFDYTATSTSEVLSFFAVGTPNGVPPFSLLDGVSLTDTNPVPDATSTGMLLGSAVSAMGFAARFRRKK